MKSNVIALLADLFNVLEVHPPNCVVSENQNGTSGLGLPSSESNSNATQFESGNYCFVHVERAKEVSFKKAYG